MSAAVPPLGPIRQSAFVVEDLDAAIQRWRDETGAGPWFVFNVDVAESLYRGRTVPMRSRSALVQSGGQQIELIEPDLSEDSVYKEFLDAGGTGIHHICYWADLDDARAHLASRGCTLVQRGVTPTGTEYDYWTSTVGVPYIELIDPQPGTEIAAFFDRIADAAIDWDGTDPIRGR